MAKRILLLLVVVVGMLPATIVWLSAMSGLSFFLAEAVLGKPLSLILLVSGFFGLVGIIYLYRLTHTKKIGSLRFVLLSLLQAWLGLGVFMALNASLGATLIATGPILVSIMLLYLTWPQLTKTKRSLTAESL